MEWVITIVYFFFGMLWAEFMSNEDSVYGWKYTPYYVYVYRALFWPVSVIVYFIGRWK